MGANNSKGSEQENQKSAMVNYARGRKTLLYLCTPFVSRIALASYLLCNNIEFEIYLNFDEQPQAQCDYQIAKY
jgi:hypothetical protein